MIILNFTLFLLAVFFCFSLPGFWLLRLFKLKLDPIEDWALSTVTGFVVFTLLGYLLLFIRAEILLLLLGILIDIWCLRKKILSINLKFPLSASATAALIVFAVGIFGQLLIIAPSGIYLNGDLVFWSAHGHDEIWHLALIQQLKEGLPLQNPIFSGTRLVNYHFFSDISIALFNRFFYISQLDLLFRFFPFFYSLLLGTLTFKIGRRLSGNFQGGLWALIFTYFCGSFGYLVTLMRDHTISGESLFWSSQVQSVSGNPPQIASFVIFLVILLLILELVKKRSWRQVGLLIVFVGVLAEFKVYGAIIVFGSLLVLSLIEIIKSRTFYFLTAFLGGGLITAAIYLPNTSSSSDLLIWQPWWFIRTMVVAPDKLNWIDLELRRQTYLAHRNFLRVAQLEIEAFLIFLFGNLGLRFLGFWQFIILIKKSFSDYFAQFLLSCLLISLALPLMFIQKGVAGNTIQFLQYFLLLFGILAGVTTAKLLAKIHFPFGKLEIGILIITLMIPTQVGLLYLFYKQPPFTKVTASEITALQFLKDHSDSQATILTPPFTKKGYNGPTPPIWLWSDTAYIPALSSRRVFISDTEQLTIMGFDSQARQNTQKEIFTTIDPIFFNNLIKQNQIKFLYFPGKLRPAINLTRTNLKMIYRSSEVEIWQAN